MQPRQPNGDIGYRHNLLAMLREHEFTRVGGELAVELGPAVPRRDRWRDRLRQVHRDRPAIERQVRSGRAEP